MSDHVRRKPKLLELHRETIRDLTDDEAENVRGGLATLDRTIDPRTAAPAGSLVTATDPVTRA